MSKPNSETTRSKSVPLYSESFGKNRIFSVIHWLLWIDMGINNPDTIIPILRRFLSYPPVSWIQTLLDEYQCRIYHFS